MNRTELINDLLKKYKELISLNKLKDEKYKWELLRDFKGKPNLESDDFINEIINIPYQNLIYYNARTVLHLIAKKYPDETKSIFKILFDEEKELISRIQEFQSEFEKLYRNDGQTLSHHQDERSISSYLAVKYPKEYPFYKYSFYKRLCDYLKETRAKTGEQYSHYINLNIELAKAIESDNEIMQLKSKFLKNLELEDSNNILLAQDVLFQVFEKNEAKEIDKVQDQFNTEEFQYYVEHIQNIVSHFNLDYEDKKVTYNVRDKRFIFTVGQRYSAILAKEGSKTFFKTISTEQESERFEKFDGNGETPFLNIFEFKERDKVNLKLHYLAIENELNRTTKSSFKKDENIDLKNIIFNLEESNLIKCNYWALGFNSDHNRLEKFISDNYWDAMDFTPSDNSSAAKKARDKFNEITTGDMVAIKGYGGKHDVIVYYIGEVIEIDSENYKLFFNQKETKLYRGKAPTGKGAGNWFDTVVNINRPDVINLIFKIGEENISDMKEHFKTWLDIKNQNNNSGKNDSYMRAIDILEEEFNLKIYSENNIEKLSEIYKDLIENQKIKDGKFFYEKAPSYGSKGFFSASIKLYLEFFKDYLYSNSMIKNPVQIKFNLSTFQENCETAGLKYSPELITRYVSSLATKPFVLLSGLSGSGKTKLAQAFAQWICADKEQYCIVPVGADWTNREPLLGYTNALEPTKYILPENGALKLIMRANEKENEPHFLILDEMNLSHVERYFADFLSVMESKDEFKLHSSDSPLDGGSGTLVEKKYSWPENLFVVGTVNIDETTYMFSPKVLDRANVIEFRVNKDEMKDFLKEPKEVTDLNGEGAGMGKSFVDIAKQKAKSNPKELKDTLENFFEELQEIGAEFGYRTASEIQTLFGKIELVNPEFESKTNEKIDIAIMQKLLPKLHGSLRKLKAPLKLLAQMCLKVEQEIIFDDKGNSTIEEKVMKYPLSFEKIARMYKNAVVNGFTSYAEA